MTPPLPAVTQDELQAQIMVVRAARAHQGLTSGLVATARAWMESMRRMNPNAHNPCNNLP